MKIFEYPYVIIPLLIIALLAAGAIWIYFTLRCARLANVPEEKVFVGLGKCETFFENSIKNFRDTCVGYISISPDTMNRLHSESKSVLILSQINPILLKTFSADLGGLIASDTADCFVTVCNSNSETFKLSVEKCMAEINTILVENEAVNMVQIKFGYYCTKSSEVTFDIAVMRAKQACIMAENDKLLYCEWDSRNSRALEKKIKIENNIQSQIENNNFFLEYQPILNTKTHRIVGAEVLSRLNTDSDGILTPGSFLSAVDSLGLNEKFDYYIFEKNCKWVSNNKEQREKYFYTINFSRSTLCEPDFAQTIIGIIEKYNLNFSSLAVEILEDKNLTESEKNIVVSNIRKLKEKNILVLLDDFGSGYTSFSDLCNFGIDIVKIDKKLIHSAVEENGFLILKNIIQTAKDLGIKTICEGIENHQHEKAVTDANSDMMQGYFYYRPIPVTQLQKILD